jgi:hypothetical protein
MVDQGTVDLDTPDSTLTLVRSSQTVAALKPKGADGFDFTPGISTIDPRTDIDVLQLFGQRLVRNRLITKRAT